MLSRPVCSLVLINDDCALTIHFLQFSNRIDEPPSTRLYNLLDARDPSNKYCRVTFDGRDIEGVGQ